MAKKRKGGSKKNNRKASVNKPAATPTPAPAAPDIIARAEELAAAGRAEEAMALLAGQPDNPRALDALGRMRMKRREYPEAGMAYEKLAMLEPAEPKWLNSLGTALTLAGMTDQAGVVMKRAVDMSPENPLYLANLAKLYMLMGRSHLAITYLERALSSAPEAERWKYNEVLSQCRAMADQAESHPQHLTAKDAGVPDEPAPETVAPAPASAAAPAPVAAAPRTLPRAPRMEPTERPLSILFVQEAPCIRNYKLASALTLRGHRVSLAYSKAKLSQMYKGLSDDTYHECIRLKDHRHLWDLSGGYDLVHCHNEPDVLSVAALGGDAPVVHDTHDLISLRAGGDPNLAFFEGLANRAAHGRLYTTPYQRAEAEKLYGVKGPCHVHYNYASAGDLPTRLLDKESVRDGAVHIVYEGGIGLGGHRDFSELFKALAEAGIHVHIYPTGYSDEIARVFAGMPTIHYNRPLSPQKIMQEMTRFDFGIIPFNLQLGNRRFLDSTIANKLFEYLAAGLPVLASPLKSYVDYFAENPVGATFENAEDILSKLEYLRELASSIDFNQQVYTHESEVPALEQFYYQVIEAHRPAATDLPDHAALGLAEAEKLNLGDLGWAEVDVSASGAH